MSLMVLKPLGATQNVVLGAEDIVRALPDMIHCLIRDMQDARCSWAKMKPRVEAFRALLATYDLLLIEFTDDEGQQAFFIGTEAKWKALQAKWDAEDAARWNPEDEDNA